MHSATPSRSCSLIWMSWTRCSPGAGCGRSIAATWPSSAAATTSAIPHGHWPMPYAITLPTRLATGRPARCACSPIFALPGMCSTRSASTTATRPTAARWTALSPRSPTRPGRSGTPMCCRSLPPRTKAVHCVGSSTNASMSRRSCRWTAATTGGSTARTRTCACTCRSGATACVSSMPPRPCSGVPWMAAGWLGSWPAIP